MLISASKIQNSSLCHRVFAVFATLVSRGELEDGDLPTVAGLSAPATAGEAVHWGGLVGATGWIVPFKYD